MRDITVITHPQTAVDLHMHSTASDGSYTPTELVELASKINLRAIALTDHETTAGITEFFATGEKYPNLECIAGVEISSALTPHHEVHLVGLFIDPANEGLNHFLKTIIDDRNERNFKMIEKLNELGYAIAYEELTALANGESVGRPLMARLLIEKGYFPSIKEAFDCLLRRGEPGYIRRKLPLACEVIKQIHQANGIALWAHPVFNQKNERRYVRQTLDKLTEWGIDGLEAYYTTFTEAQHKLMCEMLNTYHLMPSGGSDFHGSFQPGVELGVGHGQLYIPYTIFEKLKNYSIAKRNAL